MKKFIIIIELFLFSITLLALNKTGIKGDSSNYGYNVNSICSVDQFGRTLDVITGTKTNKYVGVFYFTWLGQHPSEMTGIYDNIKILAADSGQPMLNLFNKSGTTKSPLNMYHFWGEPLYQYYNSSDEFVMRRHIELLTAASVDFLVFDVTNGFTYDNVWMKLLFILNSYQQQGWNVPKVAFLTNAYSESVMSHLYDVLYKQNLYPNLWFRPNGDKPLIIGKFDNEPAAGLEQKFRDFFYFRTSQWPDERAQCPACPDTSAFHPDGFPWIDWQKPQRLYGGNLINVSPAQHPQLPFSDSYFMGSLNWGRGFTISSTINDSVASTGNNHYRYVQGQNNHTKVRTGANFQQEWKLAINTDPQMVFVTGWNQWVAIKQIIAGGTSQERIAFVDCFNEEYSNDIEPMMGGYNDAFYLQLIQNIRKYKGITGSAPTPIMKTINIHGDTTQWNDVTNIYRNIGSDNYGRNSIGFSYNSPTYSLPTPQNNLREIKVTNDAGDIYFYIKAENNITAYASGQTNWMNLFIGTNEVSLQGWEGYNFVVNRTPNVSGTTSIEKLDSTGNGINAGYAEYAVSGNIMQVKIPKTALGFSDSTFQFYFKVADGVVDQKNIMDYYVTGKSLPLGRLSFSYNNGRITSIKHSNDLQPKSFSLSQNYPNPFNPNTEIKYSIPESGMVTLKVYNLLGQVVVTLVNKEQKAGSYTVNYDASGLASGVYLYRIQAGSFALTKKMILLK